jgi:hypothetical protein
MFRPLLPTTELECEVECRRASKLRDDGERSGICLIQFLRSSLCTISMASKVISISMPRVKSTPAPKVQSIILVISVDSKYLL